MAVFHDNSFKFENKRVTIKDSAFLDVPNCKNLKNSLSRNHQDESNDTRCYFKGPLAVCVFEVLWRHQFPTVFFKIWYGVLINVK